MGFLLGEIHDLLTQPPTNFSFKSTETPHQQAFVTVAFETDTVGKTKAVHILKKCELPDIK